MQTSLFSFQSLIGELQSSVCHDNTTVLEFLPHINALLENAVSVCKAAMNTVQSSNIILPLIKKEAIAPGETKELQWRLKATSEILGAKVAIALGVLYLTMII